MCPGYLVHDNVLNVTAAIDTPELAPIVEQLKSRGWHLDMIINTHWHPDHTDANEALKEAYPGCTVTGPGVCEGGCMRVCV